MNLKKVFTKTAARKRATAGKRLLSVWPGLPATSRWRSQMRTKPMP